MRTRLALGVVFLLLLPLAHSFFLSPQCSCPDCNSPVPTVRRCTESHGEPVGPASIEDDTLQRMLIRQGVSSIEQGQAVDSSHLIQQLDLDCCQVDLSLDSSRIGDPAELFPVARESVVVVGGLYRCDDCARWHTTTASGFVISASGAIVTNYHVVDSSNKEALVVMTSDHHVYCVQRVLAASLADDLAILQVEAEGLRPLSVARSTEAAPVGSAVTVISHPDGRFYCCTAGVVSRYMKIRSAGKSVIAVAITADYARGSSGAPVLNARGQVVAVVSSTESIYYTEDGHRQEDLQMVFKTCIPSASLLKLIRPTSQLAQGSADTEPHVSDLNRH